MEDESPKDQKTRDGLAINLVGPKQPLVGVAEGSIPDDDNSVSRPLAGDEGSGEVDMESDSSMNELRKSIQSNDLEAEVSAYERNRHR